MLVACKSPESKPNAARFADIEIKQDTISIQSGEIGLSEWKSKRSFVLVDAENKSSSDLRVTLSGALLDAANKEVARLEYETLDIPAGARRTFALVEANGKVVDAQRANIEVRGAEPIAYPRNVWIDEGYIHKNKDGVVVSGVVVNKGKPMAKVVVIAGFYDEHQKPIKRPFTVITIEGGASRPVTLNGPQGSRSGYLFLGEILH